MPFAWQNSIVVGIMPILLTFPIISFLTLAVTVTLRHDCTSMISISSWMLDSFAFDYWMKIAMMLSIDLDLVLWDDKVDNQSIQAQIFHRDTTRYLHYSFQVLFPLSSRYYYTIKNDFLFFVPHPRIIPLTLIVVVSSGQTCNIDSCYLHDNPPTSCIVTLHSFLTPDLLSFLLAPSDIDHALSMLSPFR